MNREKCSFCVVGGDARQEYLRKILTADGFRETDPGAAAFLILPIPYEKQGVIWGTAGSFPWKNGEALLSAGELLAYLSPGCRVYGGCFPEEFCAYAAGLGIICRDFCKDAALTWKNAVATAEGTLAAMIQNLPVNISGSRGLIVGYGRCGSTMAAMLRPFGVKLRMSVRSEEGKAQAGQYGEPVYGPGELALAVTGVDFVINTVPAVLFTREILKTMSEKTWFFDIASSPGGIDGEAAAELGIPFMRLPGLPGKVSPVTAAEGLREFIVRCEK